VHRFVGSRALAKAFELASAPHNPRRALYNEENGLRGGDAYRDAHKAELANHILAIESDSGVFRPVGFGLAETASARTRQTVNAIAGLLANLDASKIAPNGGGADIGPIMREGVTGMSLDVDGKHYFDIHHTEADTMDKVNPRELAMCVAAMTVMAYVAAEMPERLDK
jgi:carboxypeptidase Q